MTFTRFEEIDAWKLSLKLTKAIYLITNTNNFRQDFSLTDQIRRACVSISSNIVEGFEKNQKNEFKRYLKISKGSTGEVRNQLYIALLVGYINKDTHKDLNDQCLIISKKLAKLIAYLKTLK